MLWLVTRRASSWHRLHWKIVLLLLCLKTLDRVPRCTSCKNKYPSWDNKLCYYVRVTQQLIITMQIDTYQNTSTVKKLSSSYYICNMYIQYIHCRLYSLLFIYAKAGLMAKKTISLFHILELCDSLLLNKVFWIIDGVSLD